MEVVVGILVFLGLALVGWLLNEFFAYFRRWLESLFRDNHTQPQLCAPDVYSSRFVQSQKDLEDVLSMRASCFKSPIVPDSAYYECWKNNPQSLKVVHSGGHPIGYWGVVPISEESMNSFLANKLSHEELLSERVLSWTEIMEPACLYILGVVAPPPVRVDPNYKSLLGGAIRARVLNDLVFFLGEVCSRIKVKTVAAYPTTCEGLQVLARFQGHGLVRTNTFIDNKRTQPVFCNEDLKQLRLSLKKHLAKHKEFVPQWETEDRAVFTSDLGGIHATSK